MGGSKQLIKGEIGGVKNSTGQGSQGKGNKKGGGNPLETRRSIEHVGRRLGPYMQGSMGGEGGIEQSLGSCPLSGV